MHDPTGLIIDGSLPRTDATRVADLLNNAHTLLEVYSDAPDELWAVRWNRYYTLLTESFTHDEDWEHWHELEDDVVELINDVLPSPYICYLMPDDPGTIVINRSDDG